MVRLNTMLDGLVGEVKGWAWVGLRLRLKLKVRLELSLA